MMDFEIERAVLHRRAQKMATQYYLRCGHIPAAVTELVAATASLDALVKYDPNQPRVPRGNPRGGQWTDTGVPPPGYVYTDRTDGKPGRVLVPDEPPLVQVYVVEAVSLVVAWEIPVVIEIVAGWRAVLVGRAASARRINQAAKAIEEYLGGQAKVSRNKAGDIYIVRGDKKVRFDIKNPGEGNRPHFHLEKGVHNGRKMNWDDAGKQHRYPFKGGNNK